MQFSNVDALKLHFNDLFKSYLGKMVQFSAGKTNYNFFSRIPFNFGRSQFKSKWHKAGLTCSGTMVGQRFIQSQTGLQLSLMFRLSPSTLCLLPLWSPSLLWCPGFEKKGKVQNNLWKCWYSQFLNKRTCFVCFYFWKKLS